MLFIVTLEVTIALTLRDENENALIMSAFDNSNTALVSNIPPCPRKHGIPAATEIPAPR